jgi:single-strand DNA-binding protein
MSVNKVIILGRLGQDPEVKMTPSGQSVASMSVATSESYTKDGQKQEKTEWHKIVVWGKLAEICGKYLKKGKEVYFEGKLTTRSWDDKDGVKRFTTEIVANEMKMIGGSGSPAGGQSAQPQTSKSPAYEPHMDDGVPF